MKFSMLILSLSMIFQLSAFAAPSDGLEVGSRFLVQANSPSGLVYRIVSIVGFAKDGDLFVSGMNGDPSAGLDRIPANMARLPLLAKDCEHEFCTNDQVIVGGLNGASKASILYIDHDKKEAIVALNTWANYLQRIPLSDILSVPSYGPKTAVIEGSAFSRKDELKEHLPAFDAAKSLSVSTEATGK